MYCCAEEELTDLEGEEGEGDLAEDPFSTSAEGVVRVEAQCSSRLEVKKLSPPEETGRWRGCACWGRRGGVWGWRRSRHNSGSMCVMLKVAAGF